MCLITFAWQQHPDWPLILLANRDEFHARPAAPADFWEGVPGLLAGRDLKEGGTWLGVRGSRFAALTNVREPGRSQGSRSRGHLVGDFLQGELGAAEYAAQLMTGSDDYSGFNLILGDADGLWYVSNRIHRPESLEPGVYGLSNATLDTPWPKLLRVREGLRGALDQSDHGNWLSLLEDRFRPEDGQLPDTGVGLEMERLLASPFICSPHYGTRASTLLMLAEQDLHFVEKSWSPEGELFFEVTHQSGQLSRKAMGKAADGQ